MMFPMTRMYRKLAWTLIATGIAIEALVFVPPLTPYPLVRMLLDREALELERGYQKFLETGIWKEGDPGFQFARRQYMDDVAQGSRPGFSEETMPGLRLEAFQIGESDEPVHVPEKQPVYVIYSNSQGHIISADVIKLMYVNFRKPHAANASLALLILGTAAIYAGLARLLSGSLVEARTDNSGNALSAPAGS